MTDLARRLLADGFALRRIDLGGGLGIRYRDENALDVSDYAEAVTEHVRPLGLRLFLEPGRSIAASAGVLVSEVQFIKHSEGKSFAVLDAGMNDLARPAIYGAYHEIIPVRQGDSYGVLRHRRAGLRIIGYLRDQSAIAKTGVRRSGGDPQCRRLRRGDVIELQHAQSAAGNPGRGRPVQSYSRTPALRRYCLARTILTRSQVEEIILAVEGRKVDTDF